LNKTDGHFTEEIILVSLEKLMLSNMKNHIQIARSATSNTGLAIS